MIIAPIGLIVQNMRRIGAFAPPAQRIKQTVDASPRNAESGKIIKEIFLFARAEIFGGHAVHFAEDVFSSGLIGRRNALQRRKIHHAVNIRAAEPAGQRRARKLVFAGQDVDTRNVKVFVKRHHGAAAAERLIQRVFHEQMSAGQQIVIVTPLLQRLEVGFFQLPRHRGVKVAAERFRALFIGEKFAPMLLRVVVPAFPERLRQKLRPRHLHARIGRLIHPDRTDDIAEIRFKLPPHLPVGMLQIVPHGFRREYIQKGRILLDPDRAVLVLQRLTANVSAVGGNGVGHVRRLQKQFHLQLFGRLDDPVKHILEHSPRIVGFQPDIGAGDETVDPLRFHFPHLPVQLVPVQAAVEHPEVNIAEEIGLRSARHFHPAFLCCRVISA